MTKELILGDPQFDELGHYGREFHDAKLVGFGRIAIDPQGTIYLRLDDVPGGETPDTPSRFDAIELSSQDKGTNIIESPELSTIMLETALGMFSNQGHLGDQSYARN